MISKQVNVKLIFTGLILALAVVVIGSLAFGYSKSSLWDVIEVLIGRANSGTVLIITRIRLPRILACLLGGASLALAGLLLQTLTRNPLADSGILGINAGAGMVIACVISYWSVESRSVILALPFFAMLGGILTIMVVYLIARKKNHGISPIRLIITGVGISSMLSGTMVSIVGNIDRYRVDYIVSWLSGKVSGDDWTTLTMIAPLLIILWGLAYSRSRSLNIMNLNEQTALALGLQLQKERLITLSLATALAAISVVLVGNITFVGLVTGHIARKWLGGDHRLTMPASMILGMVLLLIADTIGRVLLVGTGIPTGLIVSCIGAPYFLYLMSRVAQ
ncbi:FecCD family ABC transporter permease [Streptococcus caprae]|uniref:FecCD family ABC transporter permease n=1 Tax=Streptococcus caprae TaxID=1640501 RepID=A0ABV8CT71_9STRE